MSAVAASSETLLGESFDAIGSRTKYISAFRTRRGSELALERNRDGVYLWTEQVDGRPIELPAPEAYPARRTRNSNLESQTQKLRIGKAVWYWRLDNLSQLQSLCAWYAEA